MTWALFVAMLPHLSSLKYKHQYLKLFKLFRLLSGVKHMDTDI